MESNWKLVLSSIIYSILLVVALYYNVESSFVKDSVYNDEITQIKSQLEETAYEIEYIKYTDSMRTVYQGLSESVIKSIKIKIEDSSPISIAEEYLSKKYLYDSIGTRNTGIKKKL